MVIKIFIKILKIDYLNLFDFIIKNFFDIILLF